MLSYIENLRKHVGHAPLIMVTCGAIIIREDEILLQLRRDMNVWALHGGALEPGETLSETLIREVKEEIGLIPVDFHLFKTFSGKDFKITYPNKDVVYLIDHIFVVSKFAGNIQIDPTEVTTVKWFKLDQIPWDSLMAHNQLILKEYLLIKHDK